MKDESAFPACIMGIDDRYTLQLNSGGLTKRELFAAMAMQGLCASGRLWCDSGDGEYLAIADVTDSAIKQADALLAELAKGGGNG